MRKLIVAIVALAATSLFTNVTSADLICGEATYNCVNPANGALLIVNKKPVRFCTIDTELTKDQLLVKLSFYEQCTELGGIVNLTDMNK